MTTQMSENQLVIEAIRQGYGDETDWLSLSFDPTSFEEFEEALQAYDLSANSLDTELCRYNHGFTINGGEVSPFADFDEPLNISSSTVPESADGFSFHLSSNLAVGTSIAMLAVAGIYAVYDTYFKRYPEQVRKSHTAKEKETEAS